MKKRRSWWLHEDNYNALAAECKRRGGLSDNAMLNEIVREWREWRAAERLNQIDTKSVQPTSAK